MIIHEYVIHNMYMYAMASIRLAKIPWVGWVSKFDLYLYICYRQPCTFKDQFENSLKTSWWNTIQQIGTMIWQHYWTPFNKTSWWNCPKEKNRYPPAEKKHPAWNVDYAIDTKHHDPSELGSNWIFTSPEVYSQTGKPKCRFGSNIYPFQGKFFGNGLFYITLLFQRDKDYTLKDILPSDPLVI